MNLYYKKTHAWLPLSVTFSLWPYAEWNHDDIIARMNSYFSPVSRRHVQRQAKIHVRSFVSTQFLILTGGGFGKWIESGFGREVCQAVSFYFFPS